MGAVSLTAIVSVLVLVSMPRLRVFARTENEADARDTARLLARELATHFEDADGTFELPLIESLSSRGPVAKSLSDADFLDDGALLRRHGYLFAVVPLETGTQAPATPGTVLAAETRDAAAQLPRFAVRAWPWRVGRTGSAALLATAQGEVYRHPNATARFDGPLEPVRPVVSWDGWRRLP